MSLKSYSGGCHCGEVRFEAWIDLEEGTHRCNCSFCLKNRAWFVFVPASRFRLLSGNAALATYRWTPPGRPEPFLHHRFCRHCGVRLFGQGELEALGGLFHAVSVVTLDDVDADELAAAPIHYVDGRNDRFDQPPPDIRLL